MKKRAISTLLALCMALALLPSMAFAAEAASGTCGNNVTWTWNSGTLTISGNGTMDDYMVESDAGTVVNASIPWNDKRYNDIKAVDIESGVVNIGGAAFFLCMRPDERSKRQAI